MQDFRNLQVWDKSHHLTLDIYNATRSFPPEEMHGLTSQMRRSSVSVSANIAEGCGRSSRADFNQFMQVALGSASELDYVLILARDLGYLEESVFKQLSQEIIDIKQMLSTLIQQNSGAK